jgi:hypothetical protein
MAVEHVPRGQEQGGLSLAEPARLPGQEGDAALSLRSPPGLKGFGIAVEIIDVEQPDAAFPALGQGGRQQEINSDKKTAVSFFILCLKN